MKNLLFRIFAPAIALAGGIAALPAIAHEFWIDPLQYQVETGAVIAAKFRNGENFDGIEIAYFDRTSARLELRQDGHVQAVTPRNGDRPAIEIPALAPGLAVLAHETRPAQLRYSAWEDFAAFAAHKDFADIAARHDARGLPRANFVERYSRHAKALVAVGEGRGADRAMGLATEIVALTNPYAPEFAGRMEVEVLWQDAPRPDAQVEIFEKSPQGAVTTAYVRTDAAGRARFATRAGHEYLLDAVVLQPVAPGAADGAVWHSFWAALTFAHPADE